MGIRLTLLALGFLVVSSAQAQAQAMGHGHGTTTTFVYNNLTFRYDVQDDDFKKSPTWNPETEESPLSTRKALDIARANLQRFVLDAEKFEIEKIDLERFEPHKWVFEITFHCWDNQCSDTVVSFPIFVKLDGSIIESDAQTDRYKLRLSCGLDQTHQSSSAAIQQALAADSQLVVFIGS